MAFPAIFSALLVLSALIAVLPAARGALETQFCNKYVRVNGYTCAEYQLLTDDGYYLNIQRVSPPFSPPPPSLPTEVRPIPTSFNTSVRRPVVYLDHALFLGGDIWFRATAPSQQLPFILANKGFDVWIGNHRGTEYSSQHVNYTTDEFAYWDWDFDTLMAYDLPIMINAIRQVTGEPKIHFVGYNQGAMLAVAAASSNSTFANTLASASLIAPIAYLVNVTSRSIMQWGTEFSPDAVFVQFQLLNGHFNLTNTLRVNQFLGVFGYSLGQAYGGGDAIEGIVGPLCCVSNDTITKFRNSIDPNWVVTSYKNLVHYQQEISARRFQYWDYGNNFTNVVQYGTPLPRQYLPGNIPTSLPILLVSGGGDYLADPPNIARLVDNLATAPKQVAVPRYSHFDLLFSDTARADVFMPIMNFMNAVWGRE